MRSIFKPPNKTYQNSQITINKIEEYIHKLFGKRGKNNWAFLIMCFNYHLIQKCYQLLYAKLYDTITKRVVPLFLC